MTIYNRDFFYFAEKFISIYLFAEPLNREISIIYEANLIDTVHGTSAERKLAEQLRNSRFSEPSIESPMRGCYYVSIPALVKHKVATQEELTALNLDKVMEKIHSISFPEI